jgi:hypothetical protein
VWLVVGSKKQFYSAIVTSLRAENRLGRNQATGKILGVVRNLGFMSYSVKVLIISTLAQP